LGVWVGGFWGGGLGDRPQPPSPNPQSPIPNPQSPSKRKNDSNNKNK